jgi:hypothetical protein
MRTEWIHHLEHGSLYTIVDETPESNGVYLYDAGLGYLWTRSGTYPYLYDFTRSGWLYYLEGSGLGPARWFYDYGTGWFSLDR